MGTLTISSAMSAMNQEGAGCEKIKYEPLIMGDGMAATNFFSVRHLMVCHSLSDFRRNEAAIASRKHHFGLR